MSISTLNLSGAYRLPMIRQNEAAECGIACLAMIASYYGFSTDIAALRRKHTTSLQGMTLKSLMDLASKLNFASRPIKAPLELIKQVRLPAIVHWDMNHFVVLKSVSRNKFVIHDPALGERIYTAADFSNHFTGIALELTPSEKFKRQKEKTTFRLIDMWDRIYGLKRNLLQIFVLSIILQLFVLASPFYLQIAVDEVLSKFDTDLMLLLALGFAGFTLINFISQTLRSYVLLYFGSMLSYQMVSNLFRHLIKLPVDFFEKRHIGDIVSRFGSMEPIRSMITEGLIAGLLDGIMAITTLVMMFVYSPVLAAIAFTAWIFYFCLRLIFYKPYRAAQEAVIVSEAAENTTFIETVRGITSLKLFACENERAHIWQNKYAEVINETAKMGKLSIWFQTANQAIFGFENILIIYVAIKMIMAGEFSIGMIFAFMAYKQNFTDKASGLIEKVIEYRLLGLHFERVADIALGEQEEQGVHVDEHSQQLSITGNLTLENIYFRYSSDAEDILKGVSLNIEAGEFIAIIGPSGCGKTTLLKIMTSLFTVTRGQIQLDDKSLSVYGLSLYRKQIGVVMQEDDLFAGSIAENIAFFDTEVKMKRVIAAATTAMIHEEIMMMPMNYESFIGDMGAALSGGQKQRIMLARALYRQPKILFMDEGTAHLDVTTERMISESIGKLGITRIIIAHRPETIQSASRVYLLREGVLEEIIAKN
ncbi:MAG: ATP-binding cassette subfamily B protein RaxB [Planctomycetota bacterium]|jgi:ATP-binding cassette subfamily B protein RaxB